MFNLAVESQIQHANKDKKYNLYTNNCVDACQDIIEKNTDINLPSDYNPKPNSYFEKLKPFENDFNNSKSDAPLTKSRPTV